MALITVFLPGARFGGLDLDLFGLVDIHAGLIARQVFVQRVGNLIEQESWRVRPDLRSKAIHLEVLFPDPL